MSSTSSLNASCRNFVAAALVVVAAPLSFGEVSQAVVRVVVAEGGNPVRGVEQNAIFSRDYDEECHLGVDPSGTSDRAMAARVASPANPRELKLEVSVETCEGFSGEPEVSCEWRVAPDTTGDKGCRALDGAVSRSGADQWNGGIGYVKVAVPETTGTYEVLLTCSVTGGDPSPTRIRRKLFVTYGDPLLVVSPPAKDWYARATCWGGGFGADAPEEEVLRAIQDGLFRFGARRWRYGFGAKVAEDVVSFPGVDGTLDLIDTGGYELTCYESRCKCPWEALVAENSTCTFADCYIFSDVQQNIANTMGVPGMSRCPECFVVGSDGYGFVTHPDRRSIDPRIPSNVTCDDLTKSCPGYLFGSHSLLKRDGVYYDATFNRTYSSASDPVYLDIKSFGADIQFVESGAIAHWDGGQYGDFDHYLFSELLTLMTPSHRLGAAQAPRAKFSGTVGFERQDSDYRGLFEGIIANLEIEVETAGEYTIYGQLYQDDGSGELITSRPGYYTPFPSSQALFAEPGKHAVSLMFSGEAIYAGRRDGPYVVRAHLLAGKAKLDDIEAKTPAFDRQQFGERPAWIEGTPSVRLDPVDGSSGIVTIPVLSRQSTMVTLELRLAKDKRTVAALGQKYLLEPGRRPLELRVEGHRFDPGETYELAAELYDDRIRSIDSRHAMVDFGKSLLVPLEVPPPK